ncbi:hypothetical protein M422DRAFT_238967 [Sphaerobolus stellatus SS14]|nr:hypothetical protein M422DRAFT_238967 [Sphaerobolus stellatus SS14]
MAYLATLVYFALNSDATFYSGGGENFNYSEFYRGIITTLTDDASPEQLKELLLWWDQKVFPNYLNDESDEEDEQVAEDILSALSGRVLLKAQLRKGKVAFNNSTNTSNN